MAREFAQMNVTIWQDEDFRALPALAKQLYFDMWTHPALSYCGVVDWRPGRFAALHPDVTTEGVLMLAACLEARLFIVTDSEAEEALIRSFVRFDGLLRQPRLAVSYANAYAAVTSHEIRGVIIHEAKKLHTAEPSLVGWARPQVALMLEMTALDPRTRTLPKDPFPQGFPQGFGQRLGQTLPSVSPAVSVPPTTATATATYLRSAPEQSTENDATTTPRKQERTLPADWVPTAAHYAFATEKHVSIDEAVKTFRNHADTNDRRCRNWNSAFHTWLDKSKPSSTARPGSSLWDRPPVGSQP